MIGVGLVGYGYWGPNLARNFSRQADCRLIAICDKSPERLAKAARDYPGVAVTPRYRDLLRRSDIQAVLIATPVSFHYRFVKEALLAGKDVLVEKPLAENNRQAEKLLEIAGRTGCILAVDHTFLFTGAVRKIKELLDSKALGDLLYFNSVRINLGLFQEDVNVIHDLAPHDLSILCHLIDTMPVSVQAMGACHARPNQESLGYLHIEYPDGFMAHFHFSWLAPVKIRQTLIAGTHKMIVYDDMEMSEKVKIYDKGISVSPDQDSMYQIKVDYRTGDMVAPKLAHREALDAEAEHFLACVRDRSQPLSDGKAGARVVRLIAAAQQSLLRGGKKMLINQ